MNANEIRDRFLKFFADRGHAIIPSASLLPTNDSSVLFNTAGMQQLTPYLLGQSHPEGQRLASIQKCVRTTDIEDVGDNSHLTFFQMLGNWSLGDYFKAEAIKWSWELLTDKNEGFGLDPQRLYITVFAGDADAPRDEESAQIWQSVGVPANHIFYLPKANNWWSPGDNGPCGPDTEMFYDVTPAGLGDISLEQYQSADGRRDVIEIWNDVFMEYEKKAGRVIGKLSQKNVDTGAGLERLAMVLQNKNNVYETDLFVPLITTIKGLAKKSDLSVERIIADHLRSAVFLIADGALPTNTDRGYVVRRLLRRAVRFADLLGLPADSLKNLAKQIIDQYGDFYTELKTGENKIIEEIKKEEQKFRQTLEKGLREFNRLAEQGNLSGDQAFTLFSSYGFPLELTKELASEKGLNFNDADFAVAMTNHQALSKSGAEQKFTGGLGGNSEQIVKYHTATHLLQSALKEVLGASIAQKGSNITDERLRFDFACETKMTDDQKLAVEKIVNEKIQARLPVQQAILPKIEAEKSGATHLFNEKYGDEVSVYFIGDNLAEAWSKEFCGGPHVANTGDLGSFKITKEEAISAGVRRIKAVLE